MAQPDGSSDFLLDDDSDGTVCVSFCLLSLSPLASRSLSDSFSNNPTIFLLSQMAPYVYILPKAVSESVADTETF